MSRFDRIYLNIRESFFQLFTISTRDSKSKTDAVWKMQECQYLWNRILKLHFIQRKFFEELANSTMSSDWEASDALLNIPKTCALKPRLKIRTGDVFTGTNPSLQPLGNTLVPARDCRREVIIILVCESIRYVICPGSSCTASIYKAGR